MEGPRFVRRKNLANTNKGILFKIKNLYVLNKIFSYMTKIKTLQLVRYSKKIQGLLGINLHLYKIFNEIKRYP